MILSVLLSLILSQQASAQVPAVCTNLSAQTCAEGERNDGTGVSLLADSKEFVRQEFKRMEPLMNETFGAMLNTPQGAKLKTLAADACRLGAAPTSSQLVACFGRLYRTTEENPQLGNLYDENSSEAKLFNAEFALQLVQEPTYLKAANEVSRRNLITIPQDLVTKIEKQIFPDVQEILKKRISRLPIDEQTRAALTKKISTIKFGGIQCQPDSFLDGTIINYSTRLGESLFPNAHYDNNQNRFEICPAFLRYTTSEFDLAATIAHELAHSIDPCRMGGGPMEISKRSIANAKSDKEIENEYLRKNFISCFRSPASIGAKEFRPIDPPVEGADEDMIADDLNRLCHDDQINETISDWFAAEALAEYIPMRNARVRPPLTEAQVRTGVSNVYRTFCSKE